MGSGAVTWDTLWAVIGVIGAIVVACFTIWFRFESKIQEAEDKADKVASDLAAHKLHTAETYATKQGMLEQTSQIMRAIESVANRIDGLNDRLDRLYENPPPSRRIRGNQL